MICAVMKLFLVDFFQKMRIDRVTETRITSIGSLLSVIRNLTPLQLTYDALT